MRTRTLICTTLATLVSALGCNTRYGPEGFAGGYNDYPAGRGVHYVSFSGNGYTSKSSVTQMWHRRCAELCGGTRNYEIVARDSSTNTDFYVSNGQLQTVNKSFAEGYVRCLSAQTVRQTGKPKVSKAQESEYVATRKHPKLPELGMTPKESKALCKIQGGVQTIKLSAAQGTSDGLTGAGKATYSCRVGGILVYKGMLGANTEGFASVVGYYEGADVDEVRTKLELKLGPPDSVRIHDGYRYWSWQDRVGVRAYDSGVKVVFDGQFTDGGPAALEPSTNVYLTAEQSGAVDGPVPVDGAP